MGKTVPIRPGTLKCTKTGKNGNIARFCLIELMEIYLYRVNYYLFYQIINQFCPFFSKNVKYQHYLGIFNMVS